MKLLIGLVLGFLIGALCSVFNVPVPAPPVIQGALLVVAMTVGYGLVAKIMTSPADTKNQCGGLSGECPSEQDRP